MHKWQIRKKLEDRQKDIYEEIAETDLEDIWKIEKRIAETLSKRERDRLYWYIQVAGELSAIDRQLATIFLDRRGGFFRGKTKKQKRGDK